MRDMNNRYLGFLSNSSIKEYSACEPAIYTFLRIFLLELEEDWEMATEQDVGELGLLYVPLVALKS